MNEIQTEKFLRLMAKMAKQLEEIKVGMGFVVLELQRLNKEEGDGQD